MCMGQNLQCKIQELKHFHSTEKEARLVGQLCNYNRAAQVFPRVPTVLRVL